MRFTLRLAAATLVAAALSGCELFSVDVDTDEEKKTKVEDQNPDPPPPVRSSQTN